MRNLKVSLFVKRFFPNLDGCEYATCGKEVKSYSGTFLRNVFVFQESTLYFLSLEDGMIANCNVSHLFSENVPPIKAMLYNDIFDILYTFHENGVVLCFEFDLCTSELSAEFFDSVIIENDTLIAALEWSPDKEIAAYVTDDNKLKFITLNSTAIEEVNCEYNLTDTSRGEQELINVGWGKKETQFHGSEGKNAAITKIESVLENSFYNESVYITWRGDSVSFAVGYWCPISNKRRVKIFSKDGTYLCINEDIAGLDGPINWRPQGNLIAFSQQLPNKYVMSFMEKNGLKHLDFELPKRFKVKTINWNADSNILCLLSEEIYSKYNPPGKNYIMLWTSGNYHWYLKQTISVLPEVIKIFWDEDRVNRLYFFTKTGLFFCIEFTWFVDHSNYSPQNHKYDVSVIDNDKILVTPFHAAIIPPPMCKWTLRCPASVNKILYPPTSVGEEYKYLMCAILSDSRICFIIDSPSGPIISIISNIDESLGIVSEISLYHWVWVTSDTLVCVTSFIGGYSAVLNIQISCDKLVVINEAKVYHPIVVVVANNLNISMFAQDGKCIKYNTESNSLSEIEEGLPEPCYNVVTKSTDIYGLSEWNRLYKNRTVINYNVTSFLLHFPFLLATTSNHTLLIIKCEGMETEEISIRKLERGSKLVAVFGDTVVMQLPRGNLETIQPRALTVLSAGKLLDMKMYKEAIHLLRKQRICFDLCVDHNPTDFFQNLKHFVEVVDPQWITLLITELLPTNVTKGIYSHYYNQDREQIYTEGQKINKVCNELLEVLLSYDNQEKYILPILSCLVKTQNIAGAIKMATNEQALQHLLFLVDVDILYNEALGDYNLEAALKIACKSQMDPKEYIPYLNSLREMDNNYMKYEIDKMLKKYSSALCNLAKCGDDKLELMFKLIEENTLYNLALGLFEKSPERFIKTAHMFGEYLFKKAQFEESGIMFLRSNNHKKAIESFIKSGNWRQCMLLAKRSGYSDNEMKNLGESLSNTLINFQKFNEAAIMFKDCFNDSDRAIDLYLQGHFWEDAIYLAGYSEKEHDLETKIKKSLVDAANFLIEEINNTMLKFLTYIARLKQVRIEKLSKPKYRDIDEMSDASSISSRSNQSSTSKSSRMTKKMSRKMWSLKEGNPREEEALIATLSLLMVNTNKTADEVKNLSIALLRLNSDENCKILQSTMNEFLKSIEKGKSDIWPKDPNEDEITVLDAKYKFPPDLNIDPKWQLKVFSSSN